jgi:hypothetical protein
MRIPTFLSLLSLLTTFTSVRSWVIGDDCPTEIKHSIHGYSVFEPGPTNDDDFNSLDDIYAALTSCPNITKLDLRISYYHMKRPDVPGFPFHPLGGEKFANLTSIRLDGYEFYTDKEPWWKESLGPAAQKIVQSTQELLNLAPKKTHLDLWMDAMDWSRVEEFAVTDSDWEYEGITDEVISKLAPRLTSLRSLETRNLPFIAALPNNVLTHLKYLSGTHTTDDLSAILAAQGGSLEKLEFYHSEHQVVRSLPQALDFSVLPAKTRNLKHLTINIPRNGTWPLENFSIIASLPHLQSLDMYMDIQSLCAQQRSPYDYNPQPEMESCQGEDKFKLPYVDKQAAEEIFAHLKKEKKGVKLENVTFHVGDWIEWERGWSCTGKEWFEDRRAKVVCREERAVVGEGRQDEEGWCIVEEGEEYWTKG